MRLDLAHHNILMLLVKGALLFQKLPHHLFILPGSVQLPRCIDHQHGDGNGYIQESHTIDEDLYEQCQQRQYHIG